MSSWHGSSRHRRRRRSSLFYDHRPQPMRRCCGLTCKQILNFLSSLALPLMLGVFTVVVTFDQKNSAVEQRLDDRRLAEEQRNQDLNISRVQRLEDRELAREQRLQDVNQSILQRGLERTIADETRHLSEQSRKHELQIEDKRYRDALLTSYISEMSHLLEKNNGNLTNISLTATLSRLKTLTLIRQLDASRNSQVIRFLYEAGQLKAEKHASIDLSGVDLFDIDLSSRRMTCKMHHLHLAGVVLTGSSFVNLDLTGSNFSSTLLSNVDFSSTKLINTDFSYAIFNGSFNVHNTLLHYMNFAYANLTGIDFTNTLQVSSPLYEQSLDRYLLHINFSNANLQNTRFSQLHLGLIYFRENLELIDFTNTTLTDTMFEHISISQLDFSYSHLLSNVTFVDLSYIENTSFYMANLNDVTFSKQYSNSALENNIFDFARIEMTEFLTITIDRSSFINATIKNSTFTNCALNYCILINVTMSNVKFGGSTLYTNFDDANLQANIIFSDYSYFFNSTFRRAQMQNLIANLCQFFSVDMHQTNLSNSSMFATQLTESNLISADFTGADLTMVDFSHSNLFNARITDEQLYSTISLENSTLPNGTIAHDIPLIRNGNADCNKFIEHDWIVEPPQSIITMRRTVFKSSLTNDNDCLFAAVPSRSNHNSFIERTMSQRINVTRYRSLFNRSLAKLRVTKDCNDHVKMMIIERNIQSEILHIWMVPQYDGSTSPKMTTTNLEIKLQFNTTNNSTAFCDSIRLRIELNCPLC